MHKFRLVYLNNLFFYVVEYCTDYMCGSRAKTGSLAAVAKLGISEVASICFLSQTNRQSNFSDQEQ